MNPTVQEPFCPPRPKLPEANILESSYLIDLTRMTNQQVRSMPLQNMTILAARRPLQILPAFGKAILKIRTVKFTATYLKCVSLLDFSLTATWAGYWLLGRPKQLKREKSRAESQQQILPTTNKCPYYM